MLTYNDKMKYSATDMTPSQARKDKNEFKVMIYIVSKINIIIRNKLKIMKKTNYWKKRINHFSTDKYIVKEIIEYLGQKYYKIIDYPRMRYEIVQVWKVWKDLKRYYIYKLKRWIIIIWKINLLILW
jgi:hypothetical protein